MWSNKGTQRMFVRREKNLKLSHVRFIDCKRNMYHPLNFGASIVSNKTSTEFDPVPLSSRLFFRKSVLSIDLGDVQ